MRFTGTLCGFLIGTIICVMAAAEAADALPGENVYLVVYSAGPSWQIDKAVTDQALKEHGRYILSLHEKKLLKIAGPFTNTTGGALVLAASDEAQAKAILAEDPAIKAKIFTYELRPWRLLDWDQLLSRRASKPD